MTHKHNRRRCGDWHWIFLPIARVWNTGGLSGGGKPSYKRQEPPHKRWEPARVFLSSSGGGSSGGSFRLPAATTAEPRKESKCNSNSRHRLNLIKSNLPCNLVSSWGQYLTEKTSKSKMEKVNLQDPFVLPSHFPSGLSVMRMISIWSPCLTVSSFFPPL